MKNPPTIESLMLEPAPPVLASRRVAVLAGDGLDEAQLGAIRHALESDGAKVQVVSNRSGPLQGVAGEQVQVDHHWLDMPSVMFDAVYIPGGADSVAALNEDPDALHFTREAYEHGKAVAATGRGVEVLKAVGVDPPTHVEAMSASGVITDMDLDDQALNRVAERFIAAIIKDRHWRRDADVDFATSVSSSLPCHHGSEGSGPM